MCAVIMAFPYAAMAGEAQTPTQTVPYKVQGGTGLRATGETKGQPSGQAPGQAPRQSEEQSEAMKVAREAYNQAVSEALAGLVEAGICTQADVDAWMTANKQFSGVLGLQMPGSPDGQAPQEGAPPQERARQGEAPQQGGSPQPGEEGKGAERQSRRGAGGPDLTLLLTQEQIDALSSEQKEVWQKTQEALTAAMAAYREAMQNQMPAPPAQGEAASTGA